MRDELEFDGFWQGKVPYRCDNCMKTELFRFDDRDEAFDYKGQRSKLRAKGWLSAKVNGVYRDFCCEKCQSAYVKRNTF